MFVWTPYCESVYKILQDFHTEFDGETDRTTINSSKIGDEQRSLLCAIFVDETESRQRAIDELIHFCLVHDIHFMFIYAQLMTVARHLFRFIGEANRFDDFVEINQAIDLIERSLSDAFFEQFLRRLANKNHIRLSHLSNLIEKNLMIHYQHHLEWMLSLVSYVRGENRQECTIQLDHRLCSFGSWLHGDALPQLHTTSHFKDVERLHIILHELASDLIEQCQDKAIPKKILIQLLQRIDYLSLEIGNEIAILNDMMLISEYTKDHLTGLLTRRLFDKVITAQIDISKATETPCIMIMADLDHFKTINDTYGHLAGDEVIKNFASVLKRILRKSDFIFRFGGEEFIVLLPSMSYKDAKTLAQRVCDDVASQEVVVGHDVLTYTVSLGVAPIDVETINFVTKESINQCVAEADAKLYLAKQRGRNRVE